MFNEFHFDMVSLELCKAYLLEVGVTQIQVDNETLSIACPVDFFIFFGH